MINILLSTQCINEDVCFEELKNVINETMTVLVIPFSFGDDIKSKEDFDLLYSSRLGKYYPSIVEPFAKYGIREEQISFADYFLDTEVSLKRKIERSDILFFTGGFPDKMIERLLKANVVNQIQCFEGIVMGYSAGAMIQLDTYHITQDKDYADFSYQTGLGVVKDIMVEVHYENTDIQNQSIQRVKNDGYLDVYTIGDIGGIVINQEKNISCFGEAKKV